MLQVLRIYSHFPSDEQGFIAFIRINQESPKTVGDSLAHNPSGFVRSVLHQSLQVLVAYPWKSQSLPPSISPAELDRKTVVLLLIIPPSALCFRQDGLQPLRSLLTRRSAA